MNIATWELIIPYTMAEIERRAAGARHEAPARPARRSPIGWFRVLARGTEK